VRRFPVSRRNPQFSRDALEELLTDADIGYRHAVELGGYRAGEPGEERFWCVKEPAFRSYLVRMALAEWQEALAAALAELAPCFMCAETLPASCHRRWIADLLTARGLEVVHLLRGADAEPHVLADWSETRDGKLVVCGEIVA
jgi:uncharacterized protein (DUF488 family)